VFRTTLAADKKLGNGWMFSVEGTMTKNVFEADWQNVAINKTNAVTTGPGPRNIITGQTNIQLRPTGNVRPYTGIYLLRNTPSKTGYSYNFSAQVDKAFSNNWSFTASYAYGNSYVNNEGTSSVNASNWINMEKVSTRNEVNRTVSDFSVGHRIQGYASKKFNYAKGKLATTVALVYIGQSGNPISYTISGNGFVNDGATNNDLLYVPRDRTELAAMTFLSNTVNGVIYTPVQQQELFWQFIESNKYLSSRKGQFTERNGSRLPFTNNLDLKIAQDFNFKVKGKTRTFQVALDMFNFTNFLNAEWGRQFFAGFDQFVVLSPGGLAAGNVPQYRFTPVANPKKPFIVSDGVTPFNSSRWSSQLTVRFNF
jgi:hypothetical protein